MAWRSEPRYEGDSLVARVVEIESGRLELLMESGVTVTLAGPAVCELRSADSIAMSNGSLHAFVPPAAVGFSVATPNQTRVVDLGTEFAVRVDPDGRTRVHVIDGSVAVHSGGSVRHLVAGEAGSVSIAGRIDDDADFARALDPVTASALAVERPTYRYPEGGVGPFQRTDDHGDRGDPNTDRLTDGVIGDPPWNNGTWAAFGDHTNRYVGVPKPAVVFDLGTAMPVRSIDVHYGVNHVGVIHAPARMTVALSEDGRSFTEPVEFTGFDDSADGTGTFQAACRIARAELDGGWARFVRIELYNDRLWVLLSEVRFNVNTPIDAAAVLRRLDPPKPEVLIE